MRDRQRGEQTVTYEVAAIWARLWSALFLLAHYGIPAATAAWRHIWQEHPWPWVEIAGTLDIPYPLASLCTAASLLIVACAGLILGFATRLCAVLVLLLLGVASYYLPGSGDARELALAYAVGPTISLILGGGTWSIDGILKR